MFVPFEDPDPEPIAPVKTFPAAAITFETVPVTLGFLFREEEGGGGPEDEALTAGVLLFLRLEFVDEEAGLGPLG